MTKRPIEKCYWVVPGKLLAGEHPKKSGSMANLKALEDAGIVSFIDLTVEGEFGLKPTTISSKPLNTGAARLMTTTSRNQPNRQSRYSTPLMTISATENLLTSIATVEGGVLVLSLAAGWQGTDTKVRLL